MKMFLIATSAFALGTPALAQTAATPPAEPMAATPQSAPMTATPPVQGETTPATETANAAPSDPKALIASEFPTYDKDGNGALSKIEFTAWMTALKDKSGEKMKPTAMTTWSSGAFATADKDKSKTITLAELQTYLTAGA